MSPRSSRLSPSFLLLLSLVLTAAASPASAAAAEADPCFERTGPGATLLFPWFEVDLANPKGRRTLIAIQNTFAQDVLTNVVLWTNCGLPVVSFNLVVKGDAVRSIDLRNLIVDGRIPKSGHHRPFAGCDVSVSPPDLDEEQILGMQARLTGRPDPGDGLCYSGPASPASLASGYVTVDLMQSCSETIRTPRDPGYFGAGGIALSLNVLWGDFFLLDDEADLAQGLEAVVLASDESIVEGSGPSFYGRGDDRRALGSRYRARTIQGGAFDGGTELLAWVKPFSRGPTLCGEFPTCNTGGMTGYSIDVLARRESGEQVAFGRLDLDTVASRLKPGSKELPIEAGFGTLDMAFYFYDCKRGKCSPPTKDPVQGWLIPIYTAEGRFSVGLRAAPLNDRCSVR